MYHDHSGLVALPYDYNMMKKGYLPLRTWATNLGATVYYSKKTGLTTVKFKNGSQWQYRGPYGSDGQMYMNPNDPNMFRKNIFGSGGLPAAKPSKPASKPIGNTIVPTPVLKPATQSKDEVNLRTYVGGKGGYIVSFDAKSKTAKVVIGNETIVYKGRLNSEGSMIVNPTDPSQVISRSTSPNNNATLNNTLSSGGQSVGTTIIDTAHESAFNSVVKGATVGSKIFSKVAGSGVSIGWNTLNNFQTYDGLELLKAEGVDVATIVATPFAAGAISKTFETKLNLPSGSLYIPALLITAFGGGLLAESWKKKYLEPKQK